MDEIELRIIFNAKKQVITTKKNAKKSVKAGFNSDTSFDQFKSWFSQAEFDKGCYYCGTTNAKSFELYNLRPHATRGGKRGRRLEIDRKDPRKPYDDLDNLVWCCYWCNNAKTNFFSEKEFVPIAKAIGEVLNGIK